MGNEIIRIKDFDSQEIQLMKDTVAKGTSNQEFALFLYTAKEMGLNPLLKQVYAVMRWDKDLGRNVMTIQTGVDGFRSMAEATGEYDGQTAPMWCGEDGVWKDVWLSSKAPAACKVGVYRKGFREPIYGIARYESYKQTKKDGSLTQFWSKMPDLMLSKVAESLALRKAFPWKLGNTYTDVEMEQADNTNYASQTSKADEMNRKLLEKNAPLEEAQIVSSQPIPEPEQPKTDSKSLKKLNTIGSKLYPDNWDEKRHELIKAVTKGRTESSKELTEAETETIITGLQKELSISDSLPEISESLKMFTTEEDIASFYKRLSPELQAHKKVKALFTSRNKEISNG